MSVALFIAALLASDPQGAPKSFDVSPLHLTVAIVQDPDFPPIEPELAKRALDLAAQEFSERFSVPAPTFSLQNEFTIAGFLGEYALPVDPACKPLYEARYRGGGEADLRDKKETALKFFQKWPLDSLLGFIDESDRPNVKTYEDVYAHYVKRYLQTVASFKNLKTPTGTPLVEPDKTARRSFVAWTCAFARQKDYDVILTNTFILADLLTEPHPHAVFGKAKVGGIAAKSPARTALDGQALLATAFGIDTQLKELAELPKGPATFEQRAKILGVYLLAHEIAHAVFGIPDVFDHPKGCLMTSRPGFTYLDGLKELEDNLSPCPKCQPYVEARAAFDRSTRAFQEKRYESAISAAMTAAKLLPKQFHGSRKKRMSEVIIVASKSYLAVGKREQAKSLADAALELDPTSEDLRQQIRAGATVDASSRLALGDVATSSRAAGTQPVRTDAVSGGASPPAARTGTQPVRTDAVSGGASPPAARTGTQPVRKTASSTAAEVRRP